MHHSKAAGSHQYHGNAVGKTEQHGHPMGRADDGIAALGDLFANILEIVGTARGHRNDMIAVHLIGNE